MSQNIDALDALLLEVIGQDTKPAPTPQVAREVGHAALPSVENATAFLQQTGELVLGVSFNLAS